MRYENLRIRKYLITRLAKFKAADYLCCSTHPNTLLKDQSFILKFML